MTDEQMIRIALSGAILALIPYLKLVIQRWVRRWREQSGRDVS
jgi:hypothetical protein